ncbi:cyclic nucleotide-binding domain-containing protein 2-like [Littorina saxatilis]|uniref:cyclic nucleotide-binding domain-containing protein 2-like n=1 Tax=Littorina saxatilis TaxID=31220 RepID=UPI0038B4A4A4
MGSRAMPPPPVSKKDYQSGLLMSRRWSTPGMVPVLNLYSHYVNCVNENDITMREHRKKLCKTAVGKEREKDMREAYDDVLSSESTSNMITEWKRGKYKAWKRKNSVSLEYRSDCHDSQSGPHGAILTRKNTVSRMGGRPRESLVRMRSRSTITSHGSDTEAEEEEPAKPKKIRTFWWYCGVIKALCKLGLDMQRLSMRKTEQTPLSELYYVSVSGAEPGQQDDAQILYFDKTLFTRKRAACRCPEWAQNLMILKPENRKPEDVQRLKQVLMSMRSFREKYTDDMRTKMAQVVRYTRCNKGRVVLRQGHLGHYFYFIFSGSVFIQIDVYDEKTEQTVPSTENIIRTGESFGEIALLGDGTRSASVICREPTELCQIDKATFLDICPALFHQQLEEKIHFASRFELFKCWEEEQVKELCFLSQVMYIPHGRVVELDWSQAQFVYFVLKGRISMIKEFDITGHVPEEEREEEKRKVKEAAPKMEDWEEELRRMEEEERYNVLTKMHKNATMMQLAEQGTIVSNKRFACVGTVGEGQSTDLRILSVKPPKIPKIALLSEGVRVLRVAMRNFGRVAPRRQVEDYLKRHYVPMNIPTTKALLSRFTTDLNWKTFRKRVMDLIEREQAGKLLPANIPATAKGTSGWARWPGFDPQADEKSGRLSAKGERSKPEDFPLVKIPPKHMRRQRLLEARAPPIIRRHHTESSESDGTAVRPELTNDRTLILYPPNKLTPAFMRRSMGDTSLSFNYTTSFYN